MSKRSRTDSEHHHNDDEAPMKVVELEAKLADAERQLLYLRTLKLQKLREQAGGVATESIIQAYTDPLIHFELQALYRKHNEMVLKLKDKELEMLSLTAVPDTNALMQENKRLRTELETKSRAHDLLQADLRDAMQFIQELQTQVLEKKENYQRILKENEKLSTELFTWQQQSQQLQQQLQQQQQYSHAEESSSAMPVDNGETEAEAEAVAAGSDSPVLAVEDNDD